MGANDNGYEPPEDFNILAARASIWQHAALQIPTEREIADWPVEGDEAARAIRLSELCGDVMAAVGRGHTDVFDELSKVIACCTAWAEELAQR